MSKMNTSLIADARVRVLDIKNDIKSGYSVEEACRRARYTVKAYYADIDYLNSKGFSYVKEK